MELNAKAIWHTNEWVSQSRVSCLMTPLSTVEHPMTIDNVLDYRPLELNGSLKIYFSVYKRWCRGPAWEKGDTGSKGQHECVCREKKEALQKEQALSYGKPVFCARRRILSCCFSWVNSNGEALQNASWVLRETNLRPFNTDMIVLKAKSPVPRERLAVWQNSRSAPRVVS